MSADPINKPSLTERILISAVMILGLLASVGATAFLGYGVVTLMRL
jgi:hypothetical protein